MLKRFKEWCDSNFLDVKKIEDNIYECGGKQLLLLEEKDDGIILSSSFQIIINTWESLQLGRVDYVVYLFGTKFYYTAVSDIKNPKLNPFKYFGEPTLTTPGLPFLGVHGEYEILNGTRTYSDWVKKGSFLQVPVMGICEKNTLAGTLPFQKECTKKKIKPILGETITIQSTEDTFVESKVYVINETGWKNLLLINTEINVKNPTQFILEDRLLELGEGLVFVFSPMTFPYIKDKVKKYQDHFDFCFFQLDSVEYINDGSDKNLLLETQSYLNNTEGLKPILLCDAYYLDKEDHIIKPSLNKIGGNSSLGSENQYFKSDDETLMLLDEIFIEEDFGVVINDAIESLEKVAEVCNYQIEVGVFKLPKYIMNPDEASEFSNTEDLFKFLIELGFFEKKLNEKINAEEYLERLEKEIDVIQRGGFIEYFLILWDIVQWCKANDILTGLGRGSAAGSLVAYLLDITRVDPLPYNLLFERFLNEGRIGKALPDIDTDFESNRRDDVKTYMENKYGHDRVCSVGTYSTLQLKAALRDFCKLEGVPEATTAYVSKLFFNDEEAENRPPWELFFQVAPKYTVLTEFIQEYPEMIEKIQLCRTQPRSASVHACATIILPENESIFTSIPIRQGEVNGQKILVSEWEGEYLETAGYLKEDILGIAQLDKFRMIIDLVKENYDEDVDIYSIPLDQTEVYEMFRKGYNGDVFHLGSRGLTSYSTVVHPETIDDLTAMLALYRPGPIQNNFHNEYVSLRHGDRQPEYLEGTEKITKDTYGLFIYQEQIMQVCQEIAGFNLVEADDIRKAMGKLDKPLLASYEDRFKEGGRKKGYSEDYLSDLWEKLLRFGGYSFNKSHSLCYATTGYYCQWLKWKYPLPYWITALEFGSDASILRYISEIYQSGTIKILPPDINKSKLTFYADFKSEEIIWSIGKVKQCGEVGRNAIFTERDKNGDFFSLSEFLERVDKSKVNKSVVENLILAGAFDSIEEIQYPSQRKKLINQYRDVMNTKVEKSKDWFTLAHDEKVIDLDWWWQLQQKRVSGLAFFDYRQLIQDFKFDTDRWVDVDYFLNEELQNQESKVITTGGVISELDIRSSKKGEYCRIRIEQNYSFVYLTIWSEAFEKCKHLLQDAKDKIILVKARGYYDSYKQENALQSEDDFEMQLLG